MGALKQQTAGASISPQRAQGSVQATQQTCPQQQQHPGLINPISIHLKWK